MSTVLINHDFLHRFALLALLLQATACDWPFTTTINGQQTFALVTDYDGQAMIDSIIINLSWSEIQIEYFDSLSLEKQDLKYSNIWRTIKSSTDSLIFSYVDTLYDDEVYHYRLLIFDIDHNVYSATVRVPIIPTTSLTVTGAGRSIREIILSDIIDNDDTVFVEAGVHRAKWLPYAHKSINVIGVDGAENTILTSLSFELQNEDPSTTMTDTFEIKPGPFLDISGGLLEGITIIGVVGQGAGAIQATGGATIRQCIIEKSRAQNTQISQGSGGGIKIIGSTTVQNCVIHDNNSSGHGGGIYITSKATEVNIINCLIISNTSGRSGGGIAALTGIGNTIQNSIFVDNEFLAGDSSSIPEIIYNYIDSITVANPTIWSKTSNLAMMGSADIDSSNLSYNLDAPNPVDDNYSLLPGSPAIDAGNPDAEYNDVDGSRNDMGAYGGPYGDW